MSISTLLMYSGACLAAKYVIYNLLGTGIQRFPQFMTPLSSMGGIKEAINSYRASGTYYADPNSVNQSIGLIKILNFFMSVPGGDTLFFILIDLMSIYIQLKIIS